MVQRKLLVELGLFLLTIVILGFAFLPTISDNMQGAATIQEEIPQRYIVKYNEDAVNDPERVGALSVVNEKKTLKQAPLKIIEATPSEVEELMANGAIESYEADSLVPFAESIRSADQMTRSTYMPQYEFNGVPLDGSGQTVCIVDTGLMMDHPLLNTNQIVHTQCLIGGDNCENNESQDDTIVDDQGHGTSIAGIFALNHSSYPGLTPGGGVVALQLWALGHNTGGSFWTSDILSGIDYCIENQETYNITHISMSFGAGGYSTEEFCTQVGPAYETLFDIATENGMHLFASSGNSADTSCATCDGYITYALAQPACQPTVTSIGSMRPSTTPEFRYVERYSQRGPLLDFMAPGRSILTLENDGTVHFATGTSFAGPYAVAMSMLLAQKDKLARGAQTSRPGLTTLLEQTSESISDDQYTYDLPIFELPLEIELGESSTTYTANPTSIFFVDGDATCTLSSNGVIQESFTTTTDIVTGSVPSVLAEHTLSCTNSTDTISLSTESSSVAPQNPPQIELLDVTEGQTFNESRSSQSYVVTHNYTVNACALTLNDALVHEQSAIVTGVTYNHTLPDHLGETTIAVACTDENSNTGTASVTYTVLNETEDVIEEINYTPPLVSLEAPYAWQTTPTINVQLEAFAPAGLANCSFTANEATLLEVNYSNTNTTTQNLAIPVSNGEYSLTVTCTDTINQTGSNATTIRVDQDSPVTSLEGVTHGALYENSVSFSLSAEQVGPSGAGQTYYHINQGADQVYSQAVLLNNSGQYTITYWSTDQAGNVEEAQEATVVLTLPEPEMNYSLSVSAPTFGSVHNQAIPFAYTASHSSDVTVSFNEELLYNKSDRTSDTDALEPSQDFSGEFVVTATHGEYANSTSGTITYDTTKPTISVANPPPLDIDETFTVQFGVNDALSGVDTVTVSPQEPLTQNSATSYSFPVEFSEAGEYTRKIVVTDNAGNSRTKTIFITVLEPELPEEPEPPIEPENPPGDYEFASGNVNTVVTTNTSATVEVNIVSAPEPPAYVVESLSVPTTYHEVTLITNDTNAVAQVELTLNYAIADFLGYREETMRVLWYNESDDSWVELNTSVSFILALTHNQDDNFIQLTSQHFSVYAITADQRICDYNDGDIVQDHCFDNDDLIEAGSWYCDGVYQENECPEDSGSSGGGSSGGSSGGGSSGGSSGGSGSSGSSSSSSGSSGSSTSYIPTQEPEVNETINESANATINDSNNEKSEIELNVTVNETQNITDHNTTPQNTSQLTPPEEVTPRPASQKRTLWPYALLCFILIGIAGYLILLYERAEHQLQRTKKEDTETVQVAIEETQGEHPENHTQLNRKQ